MPLAGGVLDLCPQFFREGVQVYFFKEDLNCLCPHFRPEAPAAAKEVGEFLIVLPVFSLGKQLFFGKGGFSRIEDNIVGKVKDFLQGTGGHIQQQAHAAGDAFKVPNMGDGGCQFNVPHAFPAYFCPGDFYATAITDNALVTNALVLAAVAFPVFLGTENFLAKQAFPLRLEGSIVDGLRFLNFTSGPGPDLLW